MELWKSGFAWVWEEDSREVRRRRDGGSGGKRVGGRRWGRWVRGRGGVGEGVVVERRCVVEVGGCRMWV